MKTDNFDYASQLVHVGRNVNFVGTNITIVGGRKNKSGGISIGNNCSIYDNCQLYCDDWPGSWIIIGNNCHFNYGCYICGSGGLTIGNDCLFGPGVKIIPMNHNFEDLNTKIIDQGHTMNPIVIEDNVWIGAGAIILPNVRIKSGAVIAAGSVVTKDVQVNEIVSGIPARHHRFRGERQKIRESVLELSSSDMDINSFAGSLRQKWCEIPCTRQERLISSEMLNWSDEKLLIYWEECRRQTCVKEVRGWYQDTYKDMFNGLEIAEVGPGVGIDGIFFAQHGANVTFIDIVQDNLILLERICSIKGIKANYYYIDDFFNYHFENSFDVFIFIGSLINAPFEFTKRQADAMMPFLKDGGRIVMLAYPKERYETLGARSFTEFGKMTDGERTPWCEWYDDGKVKALFGEKFVLNWSRNFGRDGIEFNWFDLTKINHDNSAPAHDKKSVLFYPSGMWENFRGEHLFIHGSVDGSLKAFQNAVEIKPDLASAHNNLGVWYWQCGENDKAISHLNKAIKLDPGDRDIIFNCASIVDKVKQRNSVVTIGDKRDGHIDIPEVSVRELHKKLCFEVPLDCSICTLVKPLHEWKMETDDSPIFRYIYRNFRPDRHLEFGTWQGTGTLYCLEESNATVWTINLPFGEEKYDDSPAYAHEQGDLPSIAAWARKIGLSKQDTYRTDLIGFIGRHYIEKGMGHRVCQIFSDSREWDISNYPSGFFDTVLVDGGHNEDIVINDTKKAFSLLRSGGLIMWHDFCPPVYDMFEVTRGVENAISQELGWITSQTSQLFWISPSWILLGVKK